MKLSKDKPPNYDKISKAFDLSKKKGIAFTYGDTLYSPENDNIPDHLWAHEETHEKQQGDDPEVWWDKYIKDPGFRLDQELKAYRNQLNFARKKYTRKQRIELLNSIAKDLSSEIYGYLIDYKQARKMIRARV